MKRYIKPVMQIIFLLSFLNVSYGQGQILILSELAGKFTKFCKAVPNEEIFVHSDREEYIAGEVFWFNTYLVDRQSTKPSVRSKIAYIELLNPENTPIIQRRIKIENGSGPGQFIIPDTLSPGTYTLRAYTNWMKNFLPSNLFIKRIKIYNSFSLKSFKERIFYNKTYCRRTNIEYYPEGGFMIPGTLNKVAVRALDGQGQGIKFSGKIEDEKGDSITSILCDEFGIGAFELIPVKDRSYRININDSGANYTSYLPGINESGISLKVNNMKKDVLEIFINSDIISPYGKDNLFYLFIETHGNIDYTSSVIRTGRSTELHIPKSVFSTGINHITIFDAKGHPLSERLIYTPEDNRSQITLSSPDSCKKRNKIILEITLDKTLVSSLNNTNLSISVASKAGSQKNFDVNEYLIFGTEFGDIPWLNRSEMKTTDLSAEYIDKFLLTVKSNWIDWRTILSETLPVFRYKIEEDDHYLSGKLDNQNPQSSNKEKLLYLSIPGKQADFQYAITDSAGNFDFYTQIDRGQKDIIIQPAVVDGSNIIKMESSFSQTYNNSEKSIEVINNINPPYLLKWNVNYQVGKIYKQSSVGNPLTTSVPQQKPVRFYGRPDYELVMEEYIKLPVMQEVFFELLPGIIMKTNKAGSSISIINPADKQIFKDPPLLMVDGVIVKDPALIVNLDPEQVEEIDVVNTEYIVGDLILYGIINVITRNGDFSSIQLPDYAVKLHDRVYDEASSFISPDYSTTDMSQNRIPDFRNTLYWNPAIKPGSDGKARIEFWSSDFTSEYDIDIQGITAEGNTIAKKKSFKVK